MESTETEARVVPRGLRVTLTRCTRNQVRSQLSTTIDWYTLYKQGLLDGLIAFNDLLQNESGPNGDDPSELELF